MKSVVRSMIAMAAVAVVFLGSVNRCEAALRLTLTQGANTVYYYDSNNDLFTGNINVGTWNIFINTSSTNFTGTPLQGLLNQSIIVTGPVTGILTAFIEVIDTVAGFTNDGNTHLISGAVNEAALLGSALGQFLAPSSLAGYAVTQDTGTSSTSTSSGTAISTGTVNGANTSSLLNSLSANIEALQNGTAPGGLTYTMQQLLTINATSSSTGFNVNAQTGVMAVPEPATVISALFGVPALGFWLRRRSTQKLAI